MGDVVLKKLKEYFKNSNYPFVLLFGSYANSKESYLSDIDIAIYSDKELSLIDIGLIIYELEGLLDKKIDLIVLNDLYKKNPKLSYNIVANHKIVTLKSKSDYADFKYNSYRYYFDTKPLYNLFDRALLKRIDDGSYGKI